MATRPGPPEVAGVPSRQVAIPELRAIHEVGKERFVEYVRAYFVVLLQQRSKQERAAPFDPD